MDKIELRFEPMKKLKKTGRALEQVLQADIKAGKFPPSLVPNIKSNNVAYMVIDRDEICTAYSDLTNGCPM